MKIFTLLVITLLIGFFDSLNLLVFTSFSILFLLYYSSFRFWGRFLVDSQSFFFISLKVIFVTVVFLCGTLKKMGEQRFYCIQKIVVYNFLNSILKILLYKNNSVLFLLWIYFYFNVYFFIGMRIQARTFASLILYNPFYSVGLISIPGLLGLPMILLSQN